MKKSDVFAWLKENQDERGIAHWKKSENTPAGMKSYGIGLVTLRKFAKSVGRDAKLAGQLWKSDVHEMRIISLLVDDPKAMKMDQAETQVEQLDGGYLAHVTAWCEHHQIPYEAVPVGTIKRHATGKGNANKAAVIEAIRARGFNPTDDNEADAIAILLWAMETRGGVR